MGHILILRVSSFHFSALFRFHLLCLYSDFTCSAHTIIIIVAIIMQAICMWNEETSQLLPWWQTKRIRWITRKRRVDEDKDEHVMLLLWSHNNKKWGKRERGMRVFTNTDIQIHLSFLIMFIAILHEDEHEDDDPAITSNRLTFLSLSRFYSSSSFKASLYLLNRKILLCFDRLFVLLRAVIII